MLVVRDAISLIFLSLQIAILLRVLFSYIQPNPYNPIVQAVVALTEPLLAPLRRVIPPLGMFDLSPLVALIVLSIVQRVVLSLL